MARSTSYCLKTRQEMIHFSCYTGESYISVTSVLSERILIGRAIMTF